ncbi:hypothetical protein QMU90_003294 [Edwardsiella ictaluri]|uniref:Uncharacterized protein n=1 Tax=Edwardsiella ictaluri TaxID=67780 RepID=A0ABY8GGP8_EDWIC|nr:hypothetical protein [Edwardsiella ictaluri]ELV7529357.1 hypothetical protein [Edwardsiella ictaluri]WFN96487.1 hypothetical protein MAY91_17580 [Edwardsiella ictaluri]
MKRYAIDHFIPSQGKNFDRDVTVNSIDPTRMTIFLGGASVNKEEERTPSIIWDVKRSESSILFWAKIYQGDTIKAVQVLLTESNDGLLVKVIDAKHAKASIDELQTYDFNNFGTKSNVAYSETDNGYGISFISVVSGRNMFLIRTNSVISTGKRSLYENNGTVSVLNLDPTKLRINIGGFLTGKPDLVTHLWGFERPVEGKQLEILSFWAEFFDKEKTKAVKIEITAEDGNIYARVVNAKNQHGNVLGVFDFNKGGNEVGFPSPTRSISEEYGIYSISGLYCTESVAA